ncbi:MAG: histidine phosphatase family protein [Christensenellales bacterium]
MSTEQDNIGFVRAFPEGKTVEFEEWKMFYFIRHGKTNYSERNTKIYQGFGVNLSKLSELGVSQVKEAAKDERLKGADIILSSPYTRALQTAAILSKELGIDIVIETDLHEWLANKNYIYENDETAENAYLEYKKRCGKYPEDEEKLWEDAESIKKRVLKVLNQYRDYKRIIVACHGMMIQATTGKEHPACAEIVEYDLTDERCER